LRWLRLCEGNSAITFPRLAKVAIFTTNADAEKEC
jgi:hypothetical protein